MGLESYMIAGLVGLAGYFLARIRSLQNQLDAMRAEVASVRKLAWSDEQLRTSIKTVADAVLTIKARG